MVGPLCALRWCFCSLCYSGLMACLLFPDIAWAANSTAEPAAFVVMNAESGRLLLQRAAHKKMYPASTTKMATVLYVLNTPDLDLSQKLVVPQEAVRAVSMVERSRDSYTKYPSHILETGSSLAGFKSGEIITLQDVLYGAMLCSGNDAANVLAYYWGKGSIEACVEGINQYVESLGCANTKFCNPHGLHHPQHVTTAYDLALLARQGMRLPLFRQIVGSKSYTKGRTNKQQPVLWQQTNKLLLPGPAFCEQATGVKTGYLSEAKHCLVASGENKDRSLIVVLLGCQDRKQMFQVAKKLLERFLSEEKVRRVVVEEGPLQLNREIEGQPEALPLAAPRSSAVAFYPSEEPPIRAVVEWNELTFPVEEGQEVGMLRVLVDEQEVDRVPLLASEHRDLTWYQRLRICQEFLREHRGAVYTGAILLAIVLSGLYCTRRRSR
jgi:D-alanyl-D-alanine carboxypeptidase (penicillin-binding protein 5/6)